MKKRRRKDKRRWRRTDQKVKLVCIRNKSTKERELLIEEMLRGNWRVEAMSDTEIAFLSYPEDVCMVCKLLESRCDCRDCESCSEMTKPSALVQAWFDTPSVEICKPCARKQLAHFKTLPISEGLE
jgi:hypothetical protein